MSHTASTQPTDAQLVDELRRLEADLDRTPRIRDMNEYGRFSGHAYQTRFDSWNDALRAADLTPNLEHGDWADGEAPSDIEGRDDRHYRLQVLDVIRNQLDGLDAEELADVWDCSTTHATGLLRGRSPLRFRDYLDALAHAEDEPRLTTAQYEAEVEELREGVAEEFSREQVNALLGVESAVAKLTPGYSATLYAHEAHLLNEAVSRVSDGEDAEAVIRETGLINRTLRGRPTEE